MVKPVAIIEPGVVERAGIDSLRDAGYEVVMTYTKEGIVLSDRTLRDEFAMSALTGLIVNNSTCSERCPIDKRAYELADAMMEARK